MRQAWIAIRLARQGLVPIGVMKKSGKELYYERAVERLRVLWKISPLALLLEPSCGLFLLCAGLVVSFECEPMASFAWGSALEEQYVCWRAIR